MVSRPNVMFPHVRSISGRLVAAFAAVFIITAAGITYAASCFDGCHQVAMWFYENPDWGQDPGEVFDMCMDSCVEPT